MLLLLAWAALERLDHLLNLTQTETPMDKIPKSATGSCIYPMLSTSAQSQE